MNNGFTKIPFSLNKLWRKHEVIEKLRQKVAFFVPDGLFDPQDLEHQVLFRLTTYDPKEINDNTIKKVIEEQRQIIEDRLNGSDLNKEVFFRGLSGKDKILNIFTRMILKNDGKNLIAVGNGEQRNVNFKLINDKKIISWFTNDLHYLHHERSNGDAFGLFFEDEEFPWAVETTESATISKDYKKEALKIHDLNPFSSVELTRFYALPGSPRNALSVMNSRIYRYLESVKNVDTFFTSVMPMYSRTKGVALSWGMKKILLVKRLRHCFTSIKINGKTLFKNTLPVENSNIKKCLRIHPNFQTFPVVELFIDINDSPCQEQKSVLYYDRT